MRRLVTTHLAPNWALIIFFLSFLEAVGFAIYFRADLIDPELASLEPLYMGAQGARAVLHARRECDLHKPGRRMRYGDCPL
jgi:hypothetical protein